ncbi:hypothetical protein [Methylocystis hirsuta]|uniref:hypothetical protein n=1 Tax=Methylocystis hirsuta TaxID=369798 RepID=UPI001473DC6D|nr:hypothetical protein [Methylocystis hirsuta]
MSAVEAAIARPYRLVTIFEKGSAEKRVDIYPEERLAALIAMTDDLQSERLLALVPTVINSVLERWEETAPDFEETTGILFHMEEENWSRARLDPALYETLRGQMFANLEHAYSFIDFMHVESFLNETKIAATDDENESVSSGFGSYISSQFSQDLYDTSSSSEALDDMADFFSRMIREHGYDISEEYGRVMELLAERDERAERHADEYRGAWQGERNFERADEESISSMFDSLR